MPYCPNCGQIYVEGSNFCTNCGARLSIAADTNTLYTTTPQPATIVYQAPVTADPVYDNGYKVILVSRGTCNLYDVDDVLIDVLGYTQTNADLIVATMPTEVASNLSAEQAMYIAQALSEYGMQVAVWNNGQYINIDAKATKSVYNQSGSMLKTVATVLASLTAANQVSKFVRWNYGTPYVFTPRYYIAKPPVHRRRNIFQWLTPKPKSNRPAAPRPQVRKTTTSRPKAGRRVEAPRSARNAAGGGIARPISSGAGRKIGQNKPGNK